VEHEAAESEPRRYEASHGKQNDEFVSDRFVGERSAIQAMR
jgi:hypothetical protein